MAEYVPTEGVFTIYQGNGHIGDSNLQNGPIRITKISDNTPANQQFTVNETLIVTLSNGTTINNATFLGTTTAIDGGPYLVLRVPGSPHNFTYVAGTGGTATAGNTDPGEKVAPGTVSGLNIDNSAFTVCFFPGTLIATPAGERRVEDLVPGDRVLIEDACVVPETWSGRMARNLRRGFGFRHAVTVEWLGRQTVSTLFGSAERLMPVRFAAGSLGGGGSPFYHIAT